MNGVKCFLLLVGLLSISPGGHTADKGYRGPDCSGLEIDNYSRIRTGLEQSFTDPNSITRDVIKKYKKYYDSITAKGVEIKKTLLSSEKISKEEARHLMMRRVKRERIENIKNSGITSQYLDGDIYRQYYLIESSMGLKVIAEYYTAVFSDGKGPDLVNCAADMKDIYIISDHIEGHTADFAWR